MTSIVEQIHAQLRPSPESANEPGAVVNRRERKRPRRISGTHSKPKSANRTFDLAIPTRVNAISPGL